MTSTGGYFIDRDGHARRTSDPGGGYTCEVDRPARYVAVMGRGGALVHEATLYKDLDAITCAGITAELVPGSQPWGKPGAGL